MKHKLITFIGIIAAMLMIYPCANAKTYTVSSKDGWADAINNAQNESSTTIIITSAVSPAQQFKIKDGMNVTIRTSGSHRLLRSENLKTIYPLFYVYEGGTLTLSSSSGTFTINGNSDNVTQEAPLIFSKGTLNIKQNVHITNCKSASGTGAAIRSVGGTLNISGAKITDNVNTASNGGAISISSSTATINNATITGNSSNQNGGGIYIVGSTVNISNSDISGNTAVMGNGIYIADSTTASSSVTFSKLSQIADTIYCKSANPIKLAADFDKSSSLRLNLSSYKIGKVIASCEGSPEDYIDCISFVGSDYTTRTDGSNLLLTKRFIVNFKDFDGSFLKSQNVYYGESVSAPEDPIRDGYKFIGWDKDLENITDNMNVTAQYKKLNTAELLIDGAASESSYTADSQTHTVTAEAYGENVKVILAVYKNGTLAEYFTADEADSDQKYSVSANVVFDDKVQVKAMVWQDLDTLIPLSDAAQIFVNEVSE